MNTYLVTWDLINAKDYSALFDRIERHNSCRPMLSVALIATNLTATQLRDDLQQALDRDDHIFVSQIGQWATNFNNPCINSLNS